MKTLSKWFFILSLLVAPLMMGCGSAGGSSGGSSSDSTDGDTSGTDTGSSSTSVVLNLDFSALASSSSSGGASELPATSEPNFDDGSATYFTGTVTFVSTSSGETNSYDISAGLDSAFDAILNQTIALPGGEYSVSVTFSGSGQQYYGETASNVTILENSSNSIVLDVHPVIGDTIVTGSHSDAPYYNFQYTATDFETDYIMTVSIDGSVTTLTFDEFTGAAGLYINISDGTHVVVFQVENADGTVVAEYENSSLSFSSSSDLTLDLTPIFGTSTFSLTESGGDATLNIRILDSAYDEVNTETGGSFQFRFLASGAHNTIPLETLSITHDTGNGWWLSTKTYSGFQYDTMISEIVIWDTSEDVKIGGCTYSVTLTEAGSTSTTCTMTLNRKATISGSVSQVALGVNVVDSLGVAVSTGVSVYVDGSEAGITGDSDPSSDNFTIVFVSPDVTHDIYAETATQDASSDPVSYFSDAWSVDNILIWLN